MNSPPLKLLDKVRVRIRLKGYSIRTEKSYVSWIKRFILFHSKRHPQEMGKCVKAFNALLFLYNQVLDVDMPEDINACRSKKPVRLPTVMTRDETFKVIETMTGVHQHMAKLMYGSGLRVIECVRLRIKDIDFQMNQIVVRDGSRLR